MNLKDLRESCGKTRQEVAEKLSISPQALSNYESGVRRLAIEQILPLSVLYDCTAEEIIKAQLLSIAIRDAD